MKKFLTAMLFALLMVIYVSPAEAQTVENLKLKKFYRSNNLDLIIDAIGEDMNIRFIYDQEHLHRYKLTVDPLSEGSSTSLSSSDFNYYGTYQISVIHINTEYAVISQGGSTSSATLVDVKGNIDGGYGIFTGISSVTKSVKVTQGSSPF